MSKVKRQHYVPQFYLKRWVNDISDTQIWIYDRERKKSFSNSVQSVASSNYFYDFPDVSQEQMDQMCEKIEETIKDETEKVKALEYITGQLYEKSLSEIEAINSKVIKGIIKRVEDVRALPLDYFIKHQFIKIEDIVELSFFIALQHTRTTETRIVVEQFAQQFGKHLADTMIDNIDKVEQDEELKEKLGEDSFKEYIESVKSGKFGKDSFSVSVNEKYTKMQHLRMMFDIAEGIENIIKYYKWILCINNSEIPFFTCDNPVVKKANLNNPFYSNGFNSKGIEVYYPISPKYAICIIEPSYLKEKAPDLLDRTIWNFSKENVIHYNDLIVKNATSQIYSNKNEFTWVEKRLSDTPSVGDKSRKRITFGNIGGGGEKID